MIDSSANRVASDFPPDFPPVLYVPVMEEVRDPLQARVAMRRTSDGRTALLAYTALDRLHHCCGADQPWLLLPVTMLDALGQAQPYQVLLLDVEIAEEHRFGAVAGR